MSDYISKDTVYDILYKWRNCDNLGVTIAIDGIISNMLKLQPSKVKPIIYAKWHYYKNNGIKYIFKCTNCEQKLELNLSELDSNDMPIGYNYCFGCGADMKGENDEK